MIEEVKNEGKHIRQNAMDLVLYSEGAFTLKDIWVVPFYYVEEMIDALNRKQEKFEQSMKSGNTQTF